jgi:hypothetical protein
MPIYKVTEVASGGGIGCLGLFLLFGLGALVVSEVDDSGDSSPRRTTESTTSSTVEPSPEPDPEPKPDPEPVPEPESEPTPKPSPAPNEQQPERTIRERFVNGWVLERLRNENGPVALIAMYGTTAFEDRIVGALRERGVNAQSNVLKRVAYKTDPLFQRLKGGDNDVLRDLGLSRLDGHLVLCRLSLGDLNETRDGYLTKAYFSVVLVPLEGGRPARREFEARGGGFEPADAEEQARERVRSDFLHSSLADRLSRY